MFLKYAIVYKPTNEYVSFFEDGKAVLFTNDEKEIQKELHDLLLADGSYNNIDDFDIELVDVNTRGGEFVTDDNMFVSKAVIENSK